MFVEFVAGKNGDPVAFMKLKNDIRRKPAFPPRRSGVHVGDFWDVEYAGENPAQTVYFLKLIKKFDVTELVGRVSSELYLVDPQSDVLIHPQEYHRVREDLANYNQVWRFKVDHEKRELIAVERIWSDEEIQRNEMFERSQRLALTLNSLVPSHDRFHFRANENFVDRVFVSHISINACVGEDIITEMFDPAHVQEFFNEHVEEWQVGAERAEYRLAHATPDYSEHGEDHIFTWIGR